MLLEQFLDKLYNNCYDCSRLQRLPRTVIKQESKAVVEHPHTYFHADVVKRASQNIFLLVISPLPKVPFWYLLRRQWT